MSDIKAALITFSTMYVSTVYGEVIKRIGVTAYIT